MTVHTAVMQIVGLDLSLTSSGIAAIDKETGELSTAVHCSPAPTSNSIPAHVARHRGLVDGMIAQVTACDPALVVLEGLQFSVKAKDTSSARRGFLWWATVEALCHVGVPVMEVTTTQIKQFATSRGNAGKDEMVAAYVSAWPEADRGRGVQDRADAAFTAALGAAWLGVTGLPLTMTAQRRKLLTRLPEPSLPVQKVASPPAEAAA